MNNPLPFIDIHCHLLPDLDDGPANVEEALAMAKLAVAEGIGVIVATPHQSGNYPQNTPHKIRAQTMWFQQILRQKSINLQVLPGADVRIEPDLVRQVQADKFLTLADRQRHVLLELPHEVYISLDRILGELQAGGLVGILSHPERNCGILSQPNILWNLVDQGCLLQITAGSLLGEFGSRIKKFAQWLLEKGLVHFIATDAHGIKSRAPILGEAFDKVVQITNQEMAIDLFCRNPACVAAGVPINLVPESLHRRRRLPTYSVFS